MTKAKMEEGVQIGITRKDRVATRADADKVAKKLGWTITDEEDEGVFIATVHTSKWNTSLRNGGWSTSVSVSGKGASDYEIWTVEIPQP